MSSSDSSLLFFPAEDDTMSDQIPLGETGTGDLGVEMTGDTDSDLPMTPVDSDSERMSQRDRTATGEIYPRQTTLASLAPWTGQPDAAGETPWEVDGMKLFLASSLRINADKGLQSLWSDISWPFPPTLTIIYRVRSEPGYGMWFSSQGMKTNLRAGSNTT